MRRPIVRRGFWRWPLYFVLGLAVLLALLYVSLRTSFARERIRGMANAALAETFRGKLVIDRLGGVGLAGVSGVDARVFDERGQQVIRLQGVNVTLSVPRLVWQLVANADRPELGIAAVEVGHADVHLREDPEAGVSLASAFLPRETGEPPEPSPPGSGPRVRVESIRFGSVWAHGRAAGSPPLDTELRELRARLTQSPVDGLRLDLHGVELVTRGLPLGVDPRGHLTGAIESPADEAGPLRLEVALAGQAAQSPVSLEASLVGDDVHARLLLAQVPGAFIDERASGLALDGDVALAAELDGPLPQLDFSAVVNAAGAHVSAVGYAVVAEGLELQANVGVSRLDLARVASDAPETELELRASLLLLEEADEQLVGAYRLDLEPGRVGAEITPALWLAGRMRLDDEVGVATSGRLGAQENGAQLLGAYRVSLPEQGEGKVALTLDAELEDPARVQRFGVKVAGTARVSAELSPERGSVVGRASLSLRHVEHPQLQARNLEVRAQVGGTLDDPRLRAAATLDLLSGRAHVDLDYSARAQQLELFVADIDLPRLSRLLGAELPIERGQLGLDARVTKASPSASYVLDATAQADLGPLGGVKLEATQLELPTTAPTLAGLGAVHGELRVEGKAKLEALSPLLTSLGAPIERTTGQLRFEVFARHRPGDERGLELSASVDTNGLRVVQQREATEEVQTTSEAILRQPLAIEGIDLHLAAHGSPRTGEVVATLLLRDRGGTLAEVQTEAKLGGLPPSELFDATALAGVPVRATVHVPTRRLQSLPPLLRPAAALGRVAVDAELSGTARDPRMTATVNLERLRARGSDHRVNAQLEVDGSMSGGKLKLTAVADDGAQAALVFDARWNGDLRRAGELASGNSGITASASAELDEFPLEVVPQLIDRQIKGRLSGRLTLDDWGKDARVAAELSSSSLRLGQVPVQGLEVTAKSDAEKLSARLRMNVGEGTSDATLEAGIAWGPAPAPRLEHEGRAKLVTRAFQLEALNPLLSAYVSELGGVLNADTELSVTPNSTKLVGTAKLDDGVLQLPAVGQRFTEVKARLSVDNDQFKLEELSARGTTGRVTARGGAKLDGFALRGADARLEIKEHEAVPLTLEGAALGDAWGTIEAKYTSPATGEKTLDVNVAELHVTTPETAGGSLQSLDAHQDIRVGVHRADGKFVSLPLQPLEPKTGSAREEAQSQPLRVRVKLGDKVIVKRDRTATAQLTGQLTILAGNETDVQGRIEVRSGKLDVQGKIFEIERGVVTFEGNDPANPTITATARWDAPGYTVYAEYLGDVQNGRIKLHSEPPLTASEIASLLLFGSPDGAPGASGDSSNAALAVSVAGDTAAKGLNQALDDFTNLDVSARIDTTTGRARPELVFQVTPRISAKVTRAVGAPAVGESPDRTFLTLELRLKRSWALSALFGDRGASALDLIWRRRY